MINQDFVNKSQLSFSGLNVYKADKHRCVQGHCEGLLNIEVEPALGEGSHGQIRNAEVNIS